jgi:hypothetical protein
MGYHVSRGSQGSEPPDHTDLEDIPEFTEAEGTPSQAGCDIQEVQDRRGLDKGIQGFD